MSAQLGLFSLGVGTGGAGRDTSTPDLYRRNNLGFGPVQVTRPDAISF